jgi:hypothetical protein
MKTIGVGGSNSAGYITAFLRANDGSRRFLIENALFSLAAGCTRKVLRLEEDNFNDECEFVYPPLQPYAVGMVDASEASCYIDAMLTANAVNDRYEDGVPDPRYLIENALRYITAACPRKVLRIKGHVPPVPFNYPPIPGLTISHGQVTAAVMR